MFPSVLKIAAGPVKWCKSCGRKHPARGECGLQEVRRVAKSGKKVTRYALPKPRQNSKVKSKARKS